MTALGTGESYAYDANGNMTTRVEGGLTYTQTFDAENRLISVAVSGQTTQFIYDGDGNLVKKINLDGSKTLYIAGIYEVDKTCGGAVTGTRTYYPAAGAMRIGSTLYYVLKDHLGSASVVTNSSGTMVGEQRYYPFGETRFTSGTMYTDKLFTGQRQMTDLGIYYYNARFYSPYINRFLSADTIVPGYTNPQSLNRYSYVLNNPVKLTDPTGHKCDGEAEECEDEDGHPINGAGGFGGDHSPSVGAGPRSTEVYDFQYFPEAPWFTNVYQLDYAQMQQYCNRHLGTDVECGIYRGQIGNLEISIKIDGLGIRVEFSGWLGGGADTNFDLVYFGSSNETMLFISPGAQLGAGGGGGATAGILIVQNTPSSQSYSGLSYSPKGVHIPTPLGIAAEVEHSLSLSNVNGDTPQTTYIGVGPVTPEVGAYNVFNYSFSIADLWNLIPGQ